MSVFQVLDFNCLKRSRAIAYMRDVIVSHHCWSFSLCFRFCWHVLAQCEPCPPGRVCGITGMNSLSFSTPCLEGYVCPQGTQPDTQFDFPCPPGFVCRAATHPATMYSNVCPAGFLCNVGTGVRTTGVLWYCTISNVYGMNWSFCTTEYLLSIRSFL